MNRNLIIGVAGVLALLCSGGRDAVALDRRFELDPGVLDRKLVPVPAKKPAEPAPKHHRKNAATHHAERAVPPRSSGAGMAFLQVAPGGGEADGMASVRQLWDRLVPGAAQPSPLEFRTDNFNLSLDPGQYKVLPALDGGSILVDADRSLPPLIRSLIQSEKPAVRIISGQPSSGKGFFTPLLQAAGFYSVEPDFSLEIGSDPKVTVRADYRIERTAESLLNNEAVLLYTDAGATPLPETLRRHLSQEGFQIIEPELPAAAPPHGQHRLVHIVSGVPFQVADTLLSALGLPTEIGKQIPFTGFSRQGINLTVRVDRAFEYRGHQFALTAFDGNPVTYTLTRLLETQGLTVVIISPEDTFPTVARKLLAALNIPATFSTHRLWPLRDAPYSVEMTGFFFRDPLAQRNVLLTDRETTPLVRDLVERHGYSITE